MTKYNEIPGYNALTYYYHYNTRGDVVAFTDQWGTVVAKYTYDPWGKLLSVKDGSNADVSGNPNHRANTNAYRYAGYRYDSETGLYYLLARYYDPSSYRFLTKDPDGGDKDRPLSQNPYAYANGNPVMNVDPEGKLAFLPAVLLIVAILYAIWKLYQSYVGLKAYLAVQRKAVQIGQDPRYVDDNAQIHALWRSREWKRFARVAPGWLVGIVSSTIGLSGR